MTENPTKEEEKDLQGTLDAVEGFLSSERDYVEDSLRKLFEVFYTRLNVHIKLKRAIIEQKDIVSIFGNIETLYVANSKLYSDLLGLRMKGRQELKEGLGKTMQDFIPYLKVYTDYIVKTKERNDKVEELKKSNKKFREFVKINGFVKKKYIYIILCICYTYT
ncbi:calmodulin-binding protein [Reticulomyxa filosa]|uniref:Calmodulin-binding protein n=1 Tax=Reticulomyxa filosa TaxID=46433 RepID=X6LTN6_RETFI|nr:calmodulin-binding protein [Reticulomyxa filosa]|eukprot:ETO04999.1 calmodulin-binding protein [Reticulomyxa filosa]